MQTDNVVPISATVRFDQREMLIAYQRQIGAISISEALRALLDIAFAALDESDAADEPGESE